MAATATETAEVPGASSTGYEAFLADAAAASTLEIKAVMDKVPSPAAASLKAQESFRSLTDGAQSVMTTFFPQKESSLGEKQSSENTTGEGVPELAASSSSDGSKTKEKELTKETEPSLAERLSSSCAMDTACGKLEFEFMKKDEAPAPRAKALTEQGELLQIEGQQPPKSFNKQVSDVTSGTMSSVSNKATGLMVALGLAAKKDQALMTDFYKAEPKPQEPEKSLSEKMNTLQSSMTTNVSNVSTKALSLRASVMNTLGMGPEEKEMKQTLITDYDPSKATPEDRPTQEDKSAPEDKEITQSLSVGTEPCTVESASSKAEPAVEGKSSWNLWTQVKGFFSGLTSKKSPGCDPPKVEMPECPEIEVPECSSPEIEIKTPRIEIPSFTLLSCIPREFSKEEDTEVKADENKEPLTAENNSEVATDESEQVAETKADGDEPQSPKEGDLPW